MSELTRQQWCTSKFPSIHSIFCPTASFALSEIFEFNTGKNDLQKNLSHDINKDFPSKMKIPDLVSM